MRTTLNPFDRCPRAAGGLCCAMRAVATAAIIGAGIAAAADSGDDSNAAQAAGPGSRQAASPAAGKPLPARKFAIPRPHPVPMPAAKAIESSITRGIDFLLATENRDGSWGSATRSKDLNIYAPTGAHLAYRAGVTALVVSALIETRDARPAVAAAIDRGEAWLLAHLGEVRRSDTEALYNVWAHSYGIEALARLHARHAGNSKRQREIETLIRDQVARLARYEFVGGGWGYYDFDYGTKRPGGASNSFTTATALLALKEAERLKIDVPKPVIGRAIAALKLQQKPDFTYLYSSEFWAYPMRPINRPGGSLGRSQVCNLALRRWGDKRITDQVLRDWLDQLFARDMWLDLGRKRPIPHESYFQVAGYFFYYGHYYAAQCMDELPASERAPYRALLAARLLPLQGKEGSWWDFPLYNYHQAYGTAFALMSLARCREGKAEAKTPPVAPAKP